MKKTKASSAARLKPVFMVSALAAAIAASSYSYAALEEVIVTARKTDESIQDVPAAISSFSNEDLKQLNVTQTADLASFTPSIHIEQPGGNSGTVAKVTIRGQSQSDNIITLDPSVGWYIDDVYLARTQGTATSMFDVDRVEVLKGPQGTLYGRNTTGGTIKLVTTKAETSAGFTGFVVGGVGNYEQSKIGGAINIPIIPDMLAIRVSALQDKVDEGFQDVTLYQGDATATNLGQIIGHRKNGTFDNELYRVGITFEPLDNLRVLGFYEHNESDVSMANGNISANPGPTISTVLPNAPFIGALGPFRAQAGGWAYVPNSKDLKEVHLNLPNTAGSETDTASLTVEYDINDDLVTKLVYGYRHAYTTFNTDIDGTNQSFSQFAFPFEQSAYQNSVEWQLNGNSMDGLLDWVTGLYYFEEAGQDQSYSGGLSPTLTGNHYQISKTLVNKNRSRSIFAQATLHLTDNLNFTGGVRYTRDNKPVKATAASYGFNGVTTCRFGPTANVPNQNDTDCTWSNSDQYEFISWTAGFDYKFDTDVMAYIKASSSSRAGGQNTRGLDEVTTEPFQPENATDIELGTKAQFFENTLQLNAAYYHTFYTDVQQSLLINTPSGLITSVVNQAEGDINGVEIEAKWAVTDYLVLSGSAGWLDWKFDDPVSILQAAPGESYTLRGDYTLPTGLGDFVFNLNWSYQGEFFGNCASGRACVRDFEPETAESVSLLGARISLDVAAVDGLNVALRGRNLTDENYVSPALQLYFPPNITLANGIAGNPRTYGVEANYRF